MIGEFQNHFDGVGAMAVVGAREDAMPKATEITCLFLDIGGVLLSNGWDHHARKRAAERFGLDWEELESRHQLNFATYEEGRLTLDEYLDRVVFHQNRSFSREEFWAFMCAQSEPDTGMLSLFTALKKRYGLKIAAVSNEARELNDYRIRKFKLDRLIDFFISSCFVQIRKPDTAIFQMALDLSQVPVEQVLFIDNTAMHVEVASTLGISGIVHTDIATTRARLAELGLEAWPDTGSGSD